MGRVLFILAFLAIVFWVYSIVDCALQPASRHRGGNKGGWVALVILLPVVGGAMWFSLGRTRKVAEAPRRAPDDDTAFLGSIGSIRDQDERIRRLEEELAQLDAEDDDPRWLELSGQLAADADRSRDDTAPRPGDETSENAGAAETSADKGAASTEAEKGADQDAEGDEGDNPAPKDGSPANGTTAGALDEPNPGDSVEERTADGDDDGRDHRGRAR